MKKEATKLMSRPPLARIMRIHEELKKNSYPNCFKLAREIEVNPRTIARDVEFMRYSLNLPIEYDKQKHGYYYSEPVKNFPALALSEKELFSLLVAQKSIEQYKGTPYHKPLKDAFNKIAGFLGNDVYYYVRNVEEIIKFRPFMPEDIDESLFENIQTAISSRTIVSFEYNKLGAKNITKRIVHPYCLVCADNHWYLIGFDEMRQAIRTFSLPRMKNFSPMNRRFKKPEKFNLDEYLKGSLGIFKGNADYEIVIELDKWGADFLKGRSLHESQKLTSLPDGRTRLELRLNSIEEIERWVLSMGIHATVVKPKILVDRVMKNIINLSEKYGLYDGSMMLNEQQSAYGNLPGLNIS